MAMETVVLVVNTGSASKKYALYDGETLRATVWYEKVSDSFQVTTVIDGSKKQWETNEEEYVGSGERVVTLLREAGLFADMPQCVGFRVVHGGTQRTPVMLTDEVVTQLESTGGLAPLHNVLALREIRAMKKSFPNVPMVAVFDTGFHATIPPAAATYAIQKEVAEELGLLRYGFHGLSCQSIVWRLAGSATGVPSRLIVCHLGGGASITAIKDGKSVETSMGTTPLEGLMMATRSGDIDPGALLHVAKKLGKSPDEMTEWLNTECGLLGVCGTADMRDVIAGDLSGDREKQLALAMYAHRVKKYIGAYAAVLGGVDEIVFTATIGQYAPHVREKILTGLEYLGVMLDRERNKTVRDGAEGELQADVSKVRVRVMSADEGSVIARETISLVFGGAKDVQ